MTVEEFFRKKIKEKNPNIEVVTLSKELITAEEGVQWANEFKQLHLQTVNGEFPLKKEHICFDKGHSYFIVTTIDNGKSVYGHYKCSRCGHEDSYQYDYQWTL